MRASSRQDEKMVSQGIEATHPILTVVSGLPLDIYPTLLHVVLPTTPVRARIGPLHQS
jgi:hypothetical protein